MQGYYFDGETSKKHAVNVSLDSAQVRIYCQKSHQLLATWPRDKTSIANHDGEQSEFRSSEKKFAYLLVATKDLTNRGLITQSSLGISPRVTVFVLLVITLLILVVLFVFTPMLSQQIASRAPASWDKRLGESVKPYFIRDTCENDDANLVISRLVERLTTGFDTHVPIDVYIVKMPIVNAFALPGGSVILTSELISAAESSDEVAGILAHEIGHVVARHSMARVIQTTTIGIVWTAVLGDLSGPAVVGPLIARHLVDSSYSRKAEVEADDLAMSLLDQNGISRQGLIDFFKRHGGVEFDEVKGLTYLSTHPPSSDRISRLYQGMNHKHTRNALSKEDWQAVRNACL